MIIGISGKIGSGKDTVGSIIQWLTNNRIYTDPNIKIKEDSYGLYQSFEDFNKEQIKKGDWSTNTFIRKKFADKLKDIVCLLINCTREQLEDQEFKNKELGEEWWYYKLPNNSLIGYLDKNQPYFIKKYNLIKLTPRKLLQLIGTKCGREIIHPNIWVNSLFADWKPVDKKLSTGQICPLGLLDDKYEYIYPNWIITDVRFPNEAKAIKDRNGILIRVNRDIINNDSVPHESETALDKYQNWNYIINNNSTIENLIKNIKEILIKEKII